eukprot:3742175-Amphidinium_carterae.3
MIHHTTGYMGGQTIKFANELATMLANASYELEVAFALQTAQCMHWSVICMFFASLGLVLHETDWVVFTASVPTFWDCIGLTVDWNVFLSALAPTLHQAASLATNHIFSGKRHLPSGCLHASVTMQVLNRMQLPW